MTEKNTNILRDDSTNLAHGLKERQEARQNDNIDLEEIFRIIWKGKLVIIATSVLFTVGSILYALSLPNKYESEALLAPVQDQGGGLGDMASQLGGLASLAGVNLGAGKVDNTVLALEIMKSRDFIFKFIKKHELTAQLIAVKGWDINSNTLLFDDDLYDSKHKKWVREVEPPLKPEPSLQESYVEFMRLMSVSQDKTTSMVTISIEHYSPYIAQQWVRWLVDAINVEMREKELYEANNAINYLNKQLKGTQVSGFKDVMYQLIEEQTKTIMFAKVRKQYIFETVDPPLAPEIKTGPKRALICILGGSIGAILSILILLVLAIKQDNSKTLRKL
jgi:uncharacterized protein involved in exopolysaccharide biosynthesis